MQPKVIVIGAGLAGLTAARYLAPRAKSLSFVYLTSIATSHTKKISFVARKTRDICR
jgi:thioredoxin reductase